MGELTVTRVAPEFTKDLFGLAADIRLLYPVSVRRVFRFGSLSVLVHSNSTELVDRLQTYFQPFMRDWNAVSIEPRAGVVVTALEAATPRFNLPFRDWPRDPGKAKLKERIADLQGGRIVHKVRTGMHFVIGGPMRIALGPCLANTNQVINFIVTQYIEHYVQQQWQLCHAAGVTRAARGLVLAGYAGAGKSTLCLQLLRHGCSFVSNDRILAKVDSEGVWQTGVPKLPRINPGTAIHHPDLNSVVPGERRAELARLDPESLWHLEEKYDVDLDVAFGPGRLTQTASLEALVLLGWKRAETSPPRLSPVDLRQRPDLLAMVAKHPGPFHLTRQGRSNIHDSETYLRHLAGVPAFEMLGGIDFDRGAALCAGLLHSLSPS